MTWYSWLVVGFFVIGLFLSVMPDRFFLPGQIPNSQAGLLDMSRYTPEGRRRARRARLYWYIGGAVILLIGFASGHLAFR